MLRALVLQSESALPVSMMRICTMLAHSSLTHTHLLTHSYSLTHSTTPTNSFNTLTHIPPHAQQSGNITHQRIHFNSTCTGWRLDNFLSNLVSVEGWLDPCCGGYACAWWWCMCVCVLTRLLHITKHIPALSLSYFQSFSR